MCDDVPSRAGDLPPWTHRRHSRNLDWAAASWVKDVVRCSSSSSSCFLTWLSCGALKVSRLTVRGGVDQQLALVFFLLVLWGRKDLR